jgi:hypothetical protein
MKLSKRLVGVGAGALAATAFIGSGTAAAAFPNFSDCPRGSLVCVNIASRSGSMEIKGFRVPIGDSLEIRGGLSSPDGTSLVFAGPTGTSGFFAKPIQVPGGLLGIDFPIPGNAVTATARLAGPPSSLRIDVNTFTLQMPMKLELTNPIIGPGCQIGSNSNPANVTAIVGTTNPPAPNTPISGRIGTIAFVDGALRATGNVNVDNSFAIPGATNCGIGLGLINALVNAKLGLPSAGGNNALIIANDAAIHSGS